MPLIGPVRVMLVARPFMQHLAPSSHPSRGLPTQYLKLDLQLSRGSLPFFMLCALLQLIMCLLHGWAQCSNQSCHGHLLRGARRLAEPWLSDPTDVLQFSQSRHEGGRSVGIFFLPRNDAESTEDGSLPPDAHVIHLKGEGFCVPWKGGWVKTPERQASDCCAWTRSQPGFST